MQVNTPYGTPRYDRLRFVVSQATSAQADTVVDDLRAKGIGQIADCGARGEYLADALGADVIDLLLYDCDRADDDFVHAMQGIRRHSIGQNPFVIIVATVADSAVDTVRQLVRAGVDDLIRKPVSRDRLFESVDRLMESRKPFAITHDYVGPIRRGDRKSRRTDPSQLIRVPNTMRSRAVEGVSDEEIRRIVDVASTKLDDKRLTACGIEIDFLARRIVEGCGAPQRSPETDQAIRGDLRALEDVADDLRNRCRLSDLDRIADLATMLIALTQRVHRASDFRSRVDVQLMAKLGEAIRRALSVERHAVNTMQDIADSIAGYTRKN